MGKHATIGVKDLHYSIATVNEEDGKVTYEPPKRIPSVQKINISIKASSDEVYADDRVDDIIEDIEGADVSIDTNGIRNTILAELEGHEIDDNGVMEEKRTDKSKYIAIGFKSRKRNDAFRYVWLLLGKKKADSEEYETLKEKQDPKSSKLTFKFISRADDKWRYKVDSDDTGVSDDLDSKWFTKVYDGTWA